MKNYDDSIVGAAAVDAVDNKLLITMCDAEIEAGDVFISSNPYLCYVHTINWTDILPNPNFNVFINLTNTSSERCVYNYITHFITGEVMFLP